MAGTDDEVTTKLDGRQFFKEVVLTEFGGMLGITAGLLYFLDPDNVVQGWTADHPVPVIGSISGALWFRYVIWDSKKHVEKQRFMSQRPKVTIRPRPGGKKKS